MINEWLIQEYIGNNNVIIKDNLFILFIQELILFSFDYNYYTNDLLPNIGQDNNLVTSLNIISFSNNNLVLVEHLLDDNNSYKIRFNLIKQY